MVGFFNIFFLVSIFSKLYDFLLKKDYIIEIVVFSFINFLYFFYFELYVI